jgi:hypothetical protein
LKTFGCVDFFRSFQLILLVWSWGLRPSIGSECVQKFRVCTSSSSTSSYINRTESYAPLKVDLQTFLAAFHILLSTPATSLALVVATDSVVSSSGLRQQAIILSILLAIPLVSLVLVTKWTDIFDGWIERSTRTRTILLCVLVY